MIAAGIVYGIVITLVLQGTFKLARRIVRRRRAKLVAQITRSVTMSLGAETIRVVNEVNERTAAHAR